jgi:hypothetical protein
VIRLMALIVKEVIAPTAWISYSCSALPQRSASFFNRQRNRLR